MIRLALLITGLMLAASDTYAQTGLTTNSAAPLEVTADKSLEWRRGKNEFAAIGNALAKQEESSVRAETLVAQYRESAGSNMEIYRLTATGNVVLTNAQTQAFGDQAFYDLDEELAVLTGQNLKLISPDQTITAQEKFEYWAGERRANAIGGAKVIRPKVQGTGVDTLEADTISALFKESPAGEQVLHSMEAIGNVVIVTPTETVTGAYGTYKASSNIATLSGGVKILRGPNTLEGERAEVNLTTNISRIFGSEKDNGRVRGLFFPGSEKATE